MTDERVERLAQQLLDEGYVSTRTEALLAAAEVLATAAAIPDPGDTNRQGVAERPPTPEAKSPTT